MRLASLKSRLLWLVLVLVVVVILTHLPSRTQVGQTAESAAEWQNPTRPRTIKATQGPRKQEFFDWLKSRHEAREAKTEFDATAGDDEE